MRKIVLLFFVLLLPLLSLGQIEKVYPGMTLTEFHSVFPSATFTGFSPTTFKFQDTLEGIPGTGQYGFTRDSVVGYAFTAEKQLKVVTKNVKEEIFLVSTKEQDIVAYKELQAIFQKLSNAFTATYGPCSDKAENPYEYMLNYACRQYKTWGLGNGEVHLTLLRDCPNQFSYNNSQNKRNVEMTYIYSVGVWVSGTNPLLQQNFTIGVPKEVLEKKNPDMAEWKLPTKEYWKLVDTTFSQGNNWEFNFRDDSLEYVGFSATIIVSCYDKDEKTCGDSVVQAFRKYALELSGRMEKIYGKPDSLVDPYPAKPKMIKYKDQRKHDAHYERVDYYSYWKIEKGNSNFQTLITETRDQSYEIVWLYVVMVKNTN